MNDVRFAHSQISNPLQPFFSRLEQRDRLSEAEREVLIDAASDVRSVPVHTDMATAGATLSVSTLLVEGIAARYQIVAEGERQITSFHIAGDFVDLQAFPLKRMDHSVIALTPCKIVVYPHSALEGITERFPHLTRMLWLLSLLDGAIHRQWLVVMGRLSALGHMAHLFCELYVRCRSAGLVRDNSFSLPLTQSDLADALGLSQVHVNRTLQELRRQGWLRWNGGDVEILDWDGLARAGQFDPAFLHLERLPR